MKPSVLILTNNNEDLIEACLKSAEGWADEIVVVDSGSTDNTLALCKKYQARIIHNDWKGFSKQRTYALNQAKNEWVVFLDSDERLTAGVKKEIDALKPDNDTAVYRLKRKNIIMGKFLRYGGWYPDYQMRLVNTRLCKGWAGELHEQPVFSGNVVDLEGEIVHLTHRGINWKLDKTKIYTDAVAKLMLEAGHPKIKRRHLVTGFLREFWNRGIRQKGLFEGVTGFMTVFYQAFDAFIMYAKIWELQQKKPLQKMYEDFDKKMLEEGGY
jgi:glycosyltransferase involved in cell wall biosynthesis